MRISDWSSDVCSSDLKNKPECTEDQAASLVKAAHVRPGARAGAPRCRGYRQATAGYREPVHKFAPDAADSAAHRSEERREGKGWVTTCRARWSRSHKKKQ